MSDDPNNTRWSNSNHFGKRLLEKSGWTAGEGLGKDQSGSVHHVKVSRKDDSMGLGYKAGVGDTWSAQSVGFADVLDRIKEKKVMIFDDSDGEDGADSSVVSPVSLSSSSPTSPVGGRFYNMYSKRNALKTEGLDPSRAKEKAEIFGHSLRKRDRESKLEVDTESTLVSSTLRRIMVRCPAVEPTPPSNNETHQIYVTKPNPRPPKCTETPFLSKQ